MWREATFYPRKAKIIFGRPMLADRCLSCPVCLFCPVCNVGVLWQTVGRIKTKLGVKAGYRPGPHCIRWGPKIITTITICAILSLHKVVTSKGVAAQLASYCIVLWTRSKCELRPGFKQQRSYICRISTCTTQNFHARSQRDFRFDGGVCGL